MSKMFWLVAAMALAISVAVIGQTVSTEILGLVTDPAGAVVPGATITARRVATGDVRRSNSNETGNYIFPLLEVVSTKSPVRRRDLRQKSGAALSWRCSRSFASTSRCK